MLQLIQTPFSVYSLNAIKLASIQSNVTSSQASALYADSIKQNLKPIEHVPDFRKII